ncbi:MAG TPA: hypothetical protein VIL49_18805 [Capillimicrobium sp.]|jgi:hypothetical protein
MRRLLALPLAGLALAASAAPAAACGGLPVTASLASSDPTVLRDEPLALVARESGDITGLRVALRRGGRTYARGALGGALGKGRTAVELRLVRPRIRAGRYRLVVSGDLNGCGRERAGRDWRFGTPSLPVRAAPLSTVAADNRGGLQLLLRSVAHEKVRGVEVRLLSAGGETIAQTRAGALSGDKVVELPFAGTPAPGRYTLRVTGEAAAGGRPETLDQPLRLGGGKPTGGETPGPAAGLTQQRAVADWSGGGWQGRDVAGYVAPGIGYGEIVCRPDAQWIRFYPSDLRREAAMMNWTYKDWSQASEKAIREAQYGPGTGRDFREGLNKFGPAEKLSTGEFTGIISDRGPFGSVGGVSLAPPTTLKLTWQWDFSRPGDERCHVEATLVTEAGGEGRPSARSAQVAWRGDGNAAGRDASSVSVPGVGTMQLRCQPGPDGHRDLVLDTGLGAEVVTREGSEDASRDVPFGPVTAALPNNGMLEVRLADGTRVIVSSRWKANDPQPGENWCFVAAQAVVPA